MNPFKNDGDMVLKPIPTGTEVKIVCEDVPLSIPQQANEDGWNSTLNNLAAFVTKT